MKKNWNNGKLIAFGLLVLALTAAACGQKNDGHEGHTMDKKSGHESHNVQEKAVYTCPMHPEIIRNAPGSCPVCGMDLVKKEDDHVEHIAEPDSIGILLKPTYQFVLSATETIRPERKSISDTVKVSGYLTYDARQLKAVSVRYGGRIERLYVRYPFQPVQKGQRLLDIYSPDITTAQQDLIFLKEKDPGNVTLIGNARRRLSLLGMTEQQIRDVESNGKPFLSLPVFSPYAGLLVESPSTGPIESMSSSGMSSGKTVQTLPLLASANTAELSLKEGMYVQPGQRLFGLQSLATVWAILEFYPSAVQSLKTGQAVELHIESFAEPLQGKINYIEPMYSSGSKNLRVRVYLPNPGNMLKPGTLLTATVSAGSRTALWIPTTATIDLGRNKIVFVKAAGGFQSKKISIGHRSGNMLEVTAGLSTDDEIAVNGQLLMDRESFVKVN